MCYMCNVHIHFILLTSQYFLFLYCTSSIFSQLHHSIKPHAVLDYIKIAATKSFSPVSFNQLLRGCETILLLLQSSFESVDNVIRQAFHQII